MLKKISSYIEYKRFKGFPLDATLCIKGVAILIMIFHHIGIMPEYAFFSNSSPMYNIALTGKVCVSIFVFLSGFGLVHSYNNILSNKWYMKDLLFLKHRFIKLY